MLSTKAPFLTAIAISTAMLAAAPAQARRVTIPFNAANFSDPLTIDNPYFPLIAGSVYTYTADNEDGCEVDEVTVTADSRLIDGVTTRVVHDQVFESETCSSAPSDLTEDTLDYYAQDNAGDVWYFGEDSFECDGEGHCTRSEGSWIAGENPADALPGIIMLASPRSGDTYFQEQAPDVALDQATVTAVGVRAKMRRDDAFRQSYSNCIVTKEFTRLEAGSIEFKTYCPQIGNVLTVEHHGKVVRSELTAVSGIATDALKFRTVPKH